MTAIFRWTMPHGFGGMIMANAGRLKLCILLTFPDKLLQELNSVQEKLTPKDIR